MSDFIYKVEKEFLSPLEYKIFSAYANLNYQLNPHYHGHEGPMQYNEPGVGAVWDVKYRDILGETFLHGSLEKMKSLTNVSLKPVNSFYRVYGKEAMLTGHTDKPGLEYSATICIDYFAENDDYLWPIWLEENGVRKSVLLERGDALIYRGDKIAHGRPVFQGEWQTQLFLHYEEVENELDGETNREHNEGYAGSQRL